MTLEELALETNVPLRFIANLLAQLESMHGRDNILTRNGQLTTLAATEIRMHIVASTESIREMREFLAEKELNEVTGDGNGEVQVTGDGEGAIVTETEQGRKG